MKHDICRECVYRGEPQRVCTYCDEGDQFEEDTAVTQPDSEDDFDDGDEEGFGL